MHPVACIEGALGVDPGDPSVRRDRALDDGARECRLPAPRWSDELREPAARQPSAEQRGVERGDPGGERRRGRCGGREELDQFGERKRHFTGLDGRMKDRDRSPRRQN